MKLLRLTAAVLFSLATTFAVAQNAREGSASSPKGDQAAFMAEYNASEDVVQAALAQTLETTGMKKSSSKKGFNQYFGVTWPAVSAEAVDVFTKVDGRKGTSTVTLLVSKGYDNFISSGTDAEKAEKIKAFLNTFGNEIRIFQIRQQIVAQAEAVARAEKDQKEEERDGERLIRDKEKIEKEIADNRADQERKAQALAAEKAKLEALKGQLTAE